MTASDPSHFLKVPTLGGRLQNQQQEVPLGNAHFLKSLGVPQISKRNAKKSDFSPPELPGPYPRVQVVIPAP